MQQNSGALTFMKKEKRSNMDAALLLLRSEKFFTLKACKRFPDVLYYLCNRLHIYNQRR